MHCFIFDNDDDHSTIDETELYSTNGTIGSYCVYTGSSHGEACYVAQDPWPFTGTIGGYCVYIGSSHGEAYYVAQDPWFFFTPGAIEDPELR